MKFNFSFKIDKKIKYKYNGIEYNSIKEMPEDVRKIFKNMKKNDKLPDTPKGKFEDEEYDELEGLGENLVKDRTKESSPAVRDMYSDIIKSSDTTENKWYYGVVFIGMVFIVIGLVLMMRIIKIHQYGFNLLSVTSFIFVLSGFGLILRQKWACYLALLSIPIVVLLIIYLFSRPLPKQFQQLLYALS